MFQQPTEPGEQTKTKTAAKPSGGGQSYVYFNIMVKSKKILIENNLCVFFLFPATAAT